MTGLFKKRDCHQVLISQSKINFVNTEHIHLNKDLDKDAFLMNASRHVGRGVLTELNAFSTVTVAMQPFTCSFSSKVVRISSFNSFSGG